MRTLPARASGLDAGLFLVMCVVWGTTWIAAKAGVTALPPIFFAAVRYALVAVLLVPVAPGLLRLLSGRTGLRVLATGVLVNTGTYALVLWGMQHVASGVAGLVNLTMIVVGLYGLALLRGEDAPSWRHALALVLGLGGLVALFADRLDGGDDPLALWGIAAIVAGTFSYCLGSVLSRPLLDTATPLHLTGAQAITGGAVLALLSGLLEPVSADTFATLVRPVPLASLLFMVGLGTFVAYTIYLRLLRNWGAARAGLYAFVSPVVALVAGRLVYAEALGPRQVLGAALMLAAAAFAVRRPRA